MSSGKNEENNVIPVAVFSDVEKLKKRYFMRDHRKGWHL